MTIITITTITLETSNQNLSQDSRFRQKLEENETRAFEARRVDCIQSSGGLNHHDLAVFEDRWIDQKKLFILKEEHFGGLPMKFSDDPNTIDFLGKPNDSTHPLVELLDALISTLSWFPEMD